MSITEALEEIARTLYSLSYRIQGIECMNLIIGSVKTTTGDPATGKECNIVVNTVDNTAKIYADGAWRTIASGW